MAISLVQSRGIIDAPTAGFPIVMSPSFTSLPTVGNLLIVAINVLTGSAVTFVMVTPSGVTISKNSGATRATGIAVFVGVKVCDNPADDQTWDIRCDSISSAPNLCTLLEFSGAGLPIEGTSESGAGSGTSWTTGNIAPTAGVERLLFANLGQWWNYAITPTGSGWLTAFNHSRFNRSQLTRYQIVNPTSGTYAATATAAGGDAEWHAWGTAFPASAVAPPSGDGDPGAWLGDYMRIE